MGELAVFRVSVPSGHILERGDSRAIAGRWARGLCPWIARVARESLHDARLR